MKYVSRPRAAYHETRPNREWPSWMEDAPGPDTITVLAADDDGFSGLYDHNGGALYRERQPVGFRLTKE